RPAAGNGAMAPAGGEAALLQRLAALEAILKPDGPGGSKAPAEAALPGHCAVPRTPPRVLAPDVSPARARLIALVGKKWVNGTKLRYTFFDDPASEEEKNLVRKGFEVWRNVGIGVKFEEVRDTASAEVRIGFVRGDGAWSYVGRDVVDIPGRNERTMNFGWDLRTDPRKEDVAVHEIGHTLGFPHEHQNPFAGIVWDEDAVYDYFGGPPNNWDRATTEFNILRKLNPAEVDGTQWDPNSVMHYAFGPGLIQQPEQYRTGLRPAGGLSAHDVAQAKLFYPPADDAGLPELKPFRSQSLTLAPAEQANFAISPTTTRSYRMQTFGGSDTVMVLFEDQGGDLRYVDGDDDSGTALNAKITARLVAGRRYVLRLRMYSSFETGEIAVMLW
ncbi:MAG: hypothetical protein K2X87_29060, partial [Gemmataceae bacterium]|nr:hypothetical protein [Gemmataceae bacterium]